MRFIQVTKPDGEKLTINPENIALMETTGATTTISMNSSDQIEIKETPTQVIVEIRLAREMYQS